MPHLPYRTRTMSDSSCSNIPRKWKLRQRTKQPNYKEPKESDIGVVSGRKATTKPENDLFPIEVIDENSTHYRVHYVGYSTSYDEWKEKGDIVSITDEDADDQEPMIKRFSLYGELATKIKQALNGNRKGSPVIRIDIPFDKLEFDGGLGLLGTKKRYVRGIQHYSIANYQDLNSFLGMNWHYRGINHNGDFCYVILNTIEFYLYKRRPIKEYIPSNPIKPQTLSIGHMLVFCFVQNNGTPSQFGTDASIFVN